MILLASIFACTGEAPLDDTAKVDADADTDTDTDTDADADTDTDTDTDTERTGAEGRAGEAAITADGYLGTEEWYFVADNGRGDDVCRIRYTLTSVAPRTDCDECTWAYDLALSGAEIVAESDVGCAGTLGLDASTVSSLDGTQVVYGYVPEYFGHAEVLMVLADGVWDAATFASFDGENGTFSYDWENGYHAY